MKPTTALRKHQGGAVAVMVGLTIFVLVAFLGMTVDVGRLFITKTELSNAADACSLAAAAELNGAADSLIRAESAGITVGQRNKVGFQGSAVVIVPNNDIEFSEHLQGPYYIKTNPSADPVKMKYAKCTLPQTGILPYFMQAVGIAGPLKVTSHAVATLAPGITNCGLPIGMCKQPPGTCADGTATDAMGLCMNQWYCSKFTAGSFAACSGTAPTGNFNWIDFSPPSGGASELADIITGAGQCNLNITNPVGQTGVDQSLSKAWNSRFGLYKGGIDISSAPPDLSGFAYTPTSWPSKYRAYDGTSANGAPNLQSARTSHLIYQDNGGSWPDGIVLNGYQHSTSTQLSNSGSDRRLAVVPIVDCAGWASSQTTPILKFACVVLLHPMNGPSDPLYLEYQGLSDLPGSPCATVGLPGGPGSVGPQVPALVR
ncbi:MAG: pilus assembly protein TadG-related protein [Rhodocyclaceae bacterium]|nr:pilus assembly protein TadG-related protein [Rhodocyclaceae bacterium]